MSMDLVDLERALAELADSLEFPTASDLPERVVAELDRPAAVTPFIQRPAVRRVLALAAAAIVIVGVVLVASPRARRAMADLLGIGGVAIRTTDTTLAPVPSSIPSNASSSIISSTVSPPTDPPGATSVGDGAAELGIVAPVPTALGPPETTTLVDGRLSLQWPPSDALPATSLPDVGALLTVFRGQVEEPLFEKVLQPGTTYERVSVDGQPAVWLSGEPHLFLYLGPTRDIEEEELRLAGNTLIWTVGPHTYRLESALDRDAAIAVAETVETD